MQKITPSQLPDRPDTDPKPALKAKHLLAVSPFLKECNILLSGNKFGYRRFLDPESFEDKYAGEQFMVKCEKDSGKWFLVPLSGSKKTILNGEVVPDTETGVELHDGDWVASAISGSSEYHGLVRLFMHAKS